MEIVGSGGNSLSVLGGANNGTNKGHEIYSEDLWMLSGSSQANSIRTHKEMSRRDSSFSYDDEPTNTKTADADLKHLNRFQPDHDDPKVDLAPWMNKRRHWPSA